MPSASQRNPSRKTTLGSSSASTTTSASISDIDAKIAAAKAELAQRREREGDAKARFKEMEDSIAKGEEHIANVELMAVQTPELMGMVLQERADGNGVTLT